jgi:membrane protease YdiL (CAAX protease family)
MQQLPDQSPLREDTRHRLYEPSNLLTDRHGVRAGWSILVFVMLTVMTFTALSLIGDVAVDVLHLTATPHGAHDMESPLVRPGGIVFEELTLFLAVMVPSWILARIEHRPLAVYGLGRRRLADVPRGAAAGLVAMSMLIVTMIACHALSIDGVLLHGAAGLSFGLQWLVVFVFVALAEEYLTRGYLLFTLTRALLPLGQRLRPQQPRAVAFWLAAVSMSTVFALLHLGNRGESPGGIATVFAAGMLFCYGLWRTGSLWWSVGFHALWDWAQSFLFGVPDSGSLSAGRLLATHPVGRVSLSGGTDGPEASLLVGPVLLLAALLLRYTTSRGEQPSFEVVEPANSHVDLSLR